MYRKNTASQYVYFCLVNATTGAALTGATVTAYRAIDNGAQSSATGTTTELANGQYRFNLSQADTNGDYGSFLFTASNAVPVEKTVVFTQANPQDSASFGLSRLDADVSSRMASYTQPTGFLSADFSRLDASVSSRMATYAQPTGFLAATFPTTVASTTNITAATGVTLAAVTHTGAVIPTVSTVTNGVTVTTNNDKTGYTASTVSDKTGYSLLATTGLGNQTANITGNLSGSVGSVTGAVGSVTAAVAVSDKTGFKLASDGLALVTAWTVGITGNITGNLSGSVGSVTGAVGSVTSAVTVGTINADVITASALAADAATEIATAVAATQALSRLDSMIESDGAGQFRFDTIALSMGAGGAGGTDWTANERTAIRSILGVPTSGTTPSDPTVGILDTIRDKTNLITTGTIASSIPVTASGQIDGPLVIGDDYLSANGRAFTWTVALPSAFVIATSTCKFGMQYQDEDGTYSFNVSGTVTDAGSGNVTLTFDVPKATTGTLGPGWYRWSVEIASASGTEVTRVKSSHNKLVEWVEKQT